MARVQPKSKEKTGVQHVSIIAGSLRVFSGEEFLTTDPEKKTIFSRLKLPYVGCVARNASCFKHEAQNSTHQPTASCSSKAASALASRDFSSALAKNSYRVDRSDDTGKERGNRSFFLFAHQDLSVRLASAAEGET